MSLFEFKKPLIEFFTYDPVLLATPELHPQPASKFFPHWFKSMSSSKKAIDSSGNKIPGTIRDCPVFAEYLTQGYIIPMWCDTILYSGSNGEWRVNTPHNDYTWDMHPSHQYLDFIPDIKNKENMTVFKALCPWFIRTPNNYSVYDMDLSYHFNQDFKVLSGCFKSDVFPQLNPQVLIFEKDKEIFIPRGTPFAWYVPFKREKYKLNISAVDTPEKHTHMNRALSAVKTKFKGGYKLLSKEKN